MNPLYLRASPLILMLLVSIALALGLCSDASKISSAGKLIGYNVAPFDLPSANGPTVRFSPNVWKDQVVLLNVFATWCEPCAAEHEVLMRMAQTGKVIIYGLAWKDKPEDVVEWLNARGNPYQLVGIDQYSQTTIPLALSGVPESFIIDRDGKIYYHYNRPITDEDANNVVIPLIDKLTRGEIK